MDSNPIAASGLVSIITPAFNAAQFLPETIQTVLAQSYFNWEWLVVDDCSEDHTALLIQKAAKQDVRIRPLTMFKKSLTTAHVRNYAMARAKGEFFAFLDADDLWEPNKLERQLTHLSQHPSAAGVCNWIDMFGYSPRVVNTHLFFNPKVIIEHREFVQSMPMWAPTVLFRRQCYDEMGGMDDDPRLFVGEDEEYFARLTSRYEFHRLGEVLTHVRVHPPGESLSAALLQKGGLERLNMVSVLEEKGLITFSEAQHMRARKYATEASDALFIRHVPFRRYLLKAMCTGHPPLQAVVMLLLSFLPAVLLRPVLAKMQGLRQRWQLWKASQSSTYCTCRNESLI